MYYHSLNAINKCSLQIACRAWNLQEMEIPVLANDLQLTFINRVETTV